MRKVAVLAALLAVGLGAVGQVTISFWHAMSGSHGDVLTALVRKFEQENPTIKVELVFQGGYGALQQKLTAAIAAKTPPTLAQEYENWTTQWLDALVDLDLFLPEDLLADLLPQFNQVFSGRIVSVPFNKSILVLYYRSDLVPNPPKTWAEFETYVTRIGKDAGKGIYGTAFRPTNPEIFLAFLEQAGGSILSPDWKTVTINNAQGLEAAEFAARLAKNALVQGAFISEAIAKGITIGMWVDTSAGYPFNMRAARTANVPLAVAPVPCYKNCASMIQGTNLVVYAPNQTKAQIEAAAKLIAFLLREDNLVEWCQKTGYLPVRKSVIEGKAWQEHIAKDPAARVMTEQLLAGGFGQLLHPRYMEMRSLLITYWELLLKGEETPKKIFDALAQEIEGLLK